MAAFSQMAPGVRGAQAVVSFGLAAAPLRLAPQARVSSSDCMVGSVRGGVPAASASSLRLGTIQVQTCSGGLACSAAH